MRADKRTLVALEIFRSEVSYLRTLQIVRDIFHKPLESALSYNRYMLIISMFFHVIITCIVQDIILCFL